MPVMKLGIAVVYLVREDSEPLLRLHLERIRRHTRVRYVIYGVPLRLPPEFFLHLQSEEIRLLSPAPRSDVIAPVEHSTLLTELLNLAAQDGCSHLGTLHVDSFPVVDDWVERMAGLLTPQAPVAAVMEEMEGDTCARPNLAGMMIVADYWRQARPFLLPTLELERTADWRDFLVRHRQGVSHSGVGLGYCLERDGKSWSPLPRTNSRRRHPVLAGVYGDAIFHLGAATRPPIFFTENIPAEESEGMRRRRKSVAAVRQVLPPRLRRTLRPLRRFGNLYDQRPLRHNEAIFAQIRRELFADPNGFLASAMSNSGNAVS